MAEKKTTCFLHTVEGQYGTFVAFLTSVSICTSTFNSLPNKFIPFLCGEIFMLALKM